MSEAATPMRPSSSTVMVTGGAGFIGSTLVRELLATTPHRVLTLDALTYAGGLDNLDEVMDDPRHHFVHGEVNDARLLSRLLREHRPIAILHLAAETHVDRSIDDPAAFVHANLLGTFELLEAVRHHVSDLGRAERAGFRLVHVSSDEVFGSLGDDGAFHLGSPYDPRSPYSATKAGSDHLARAYHHSYGLPVVVTNCANNYGPRQFPEKLIPRIVLRALRGLPLEVYGRGLQVREWLHVRDHASGLIAAALRGQPGSTYLFGGGTELTSLQVTEAVCRVLDELRPQAAPHAEAIAFVPDRPGHDHRYAIDPASAAEGLGWAPRHAFHDGLRETLSWYLSHLDWCERRAGDGGALNRMGRPTAETPA